MTVMKPWDGALVPQKLYRWYTPVVSARGGGGRNSRSFLALDVTCISNLSESCECLIDTLHRVFSYCHCSEVPELAKPLVNNV